MLTLYRRLVSFQVRSQMAYPLPFLLDFLATALIVLISFITIALVLQRFGDIAGWTLWEVAFLYGTVEFAFGVMDLVFGGFDPDYFALQIRTGALDQMLLRPVSVAVQIFSTNIQMRRFGRIAQGGLVLGLALTRAPIDWTWAKAAYLPLMLAGIVLFFGGLFVFGSTLTFWTVERIEAVNIFTYGGTEMMAYPMSVYPLWMRRFFTFIVPAIFLNYYPALYFLDKPDPLGFPGFAPFLAPLAGLLVFLGAARFWQFGLQHYQSTGS